MRFSTMTSTANALLAHKAAPAQAHVSFPDASFRRILRVREVRYQPGSGIALGDEHRR
jgi:hypothetical protein